MVDPDKTNIHPKDGEGVVVNARRARQGFRDRPVLYVLVISTTLAMLTLGWMVLLD